MRHFRLLFNVLVFISSVVWLTFLSWVHADFIGDYGLTSSNRFLWIFTYCGFFSLLTYLIGFPDQIDPKKRTGSIIFPTITTTVLFAILQSAIGEFVLPRFVLILSIGLLAINLLINVSVYKIITKTVVPLESILLISSSKEKQEIEKDVSKDSEILCAIAIHVDTQMDRELVREVIIEREKNHSFALVVVDSTHQIDSTIQKNLIDLHSQGVKVRSVVEFYDEYIGKLPIRHLEHNPMLFDISEVHTPWYPRLSRLLDLFVSILLLPVLVVITPCVYIGNLVGNRGSLFYRQTRVGKNDKEFVILKFRSMRDEVHDNHWTQENDERITIFGKFLRLSHVDELPQILNIIKGDLSIVGPRPEQPSYVAQLKESIPMYGTRHFIRPGLTGWAQVKYPYGASQIDAYEKLQYELWYLRNQSIWLDIKILLLTLRHLVNVGGR